MVCPLDRAISEKLQVLQHDGGLKTGSIDSGELQVSVSAICEAGSIAGVLVGWQDIIRLTEFERTNAKTVVALKGEKEGPERHRELYDESRKRDELYRSLLNSSADAIVISDLEGHTEYVSPSFTRMFGWELEEIEGELIPFLPDSEREATMAAIGKIVQEGTPLSSFETRRYTKDGRVLDISMSASRYLDRGRPAVFWQQGGVDIDGPLWR